MNNIPKYIKYKELGLCLRCGNERDIGKSRCSTCHKKHLQYQQNSHEKRIKNGICRYCSINPIEHCESMCLKCATKLKIKAKGLYQNIRTECIEQYGGKCKCCKNPNKKYLQLDHIHNDGALHRKTIGKKSLYVWAKNNNFPDILQLLCANCHQAKTTNNPCTEEDHLSFCQV